MEAQADMVIIPTILMDQDLILIKEDIQELNNHLHMEDKDMPKIQIMDKDYQILLMNMV